MYPRHIVLVTCFNPKNNKSNIISVAWSTPLSHEPPLIGISIAPKRYSHDLISKTGEFVVNIPTIELAKQVLFCGRRSGRDVDKFNETKLTARVARKVRASIIEECIAHLECKVVNQIEVGDHTLFIGEVVAAYVNEGLFEKVFDVKKVKVLHHLGEDLFVTNSSEVINPQL
ncbi:MAG: flavin reductase family protein [Nitrososphaerales archaeon]|nr:flavin reductase family protein [Nitrososphaerales archaeon]